jgi:hypothetical protein
MVGLAEDSSKERHDAIYVCGCGEACGCDTVSLEPGDCGCAKPLVAGHVVKIEGSDALVCTHGKDCTCTVSSDDPGRCSCGMELRRVSLEDTGIHFCNCGGSCTCNHLSQEPGTCACGMPLHLAKN